MTCAFLVLAILLELCIYVFSGEEQQRLRGLEQSYIPVKQIESNCGIRHACPENSFPIYVSTGTSADDHPKLCVSGKYVIRPTSKEQGRGLNAAVVDPHHFEVISVRNFDTYLYNKTLEISEWINGILDNDILIIFTSDEASVKLTPQTKLLLTQMGSGKVQNLQYRSQWYMITQKGTKGFTIYEKITYSKKRSWGEAIEFRGCIPRKIPKKKITADEPLKENRRKVQFCEGKREMKYKGFCSEPRFEIIMPALLTNKSLLSNPVYSLPIFVFAGKDLEVLIAALDSMMHQPGIIMSSVTVFYKDNVDDIPGLTNIYGMRANKSNFPDSFEKKLKMAREIATKVYPKKNHVIVLDSNVIPSPDFLFYFAQTFSIFEKDNMVSAISAWSANCYNHEGNVHTAYRIKGVPRYAALIPTNITQASDKVTTEMYAPDVARVQGLEACHLPSLESSNWIERPQDLSKERYFQKLIILQQLSHVVSVNELLNSSSRKVLKNGTNTIYLQDRRKLPEVLRFLGVVNNQFGEYDGIVRLYTRKKTVLVITSKSSFYKSRPIISV